MVRRLLNHQWNALTNRHEARCTKCQQLVAFITDEALYRYPDHQPRAVLHRCPCTCDTDPYNCPVGQRLVIAITDRKGNQNVRTAG